LLKEVLADPRKESYDSKMKEFSTYNKAFNKRKRGVIIEFELLLLQFRMPKRADYELWKPSLP
jgi:hypothetical protein